MASQASRTLAEFFRREVGRSLRLVAHYTAEDVEFVYVRDDVAGTYDPEEVLSTFAIHREDTHTALAQESAMEAGKHHCTLRIFDEAIVFNFTQSEDIGTIVSLEPDIGQNLLTFVTQCLERLNDASPQTVKPPTWTSTGR